MTKLPSNGYVLGLDVGEKRIGAAITSVIAKLPRPIGDIANNETVLQSIQTLIQSESAALVVVGIPRNLNGEETAQSEYIRAFAAQLKDKITVPIVFADESLSSVRADEVLKSKTFKKATRDSLAACFILEEYIKTAGEELK